MSLGDTTATRPEAPSLAVRAEEVCLAAWPAPRSIVMDGWVLRFAGGHTTRANSVNLVGPSVWSDRDKILACEALYRAQGLPTIFRLSSALPHRDLDRALDDAGYGPPRDRSLVLHAAIGGATAGRAAAGRDEVLLAEGRPDARWLAASAELGGLDPVAAAQRERIFDALAIPAASAAIAIDGRVAAQAFGAVLCGLVCLNTVATAPTFRGRGLAGRAVSAILAWAAERHGAAGACLQVGADNAPALSLYRRLGFASDLSCYHYRDAAPG